MGPVEGTRLALGSSLELGEDSSRLEAAAWDIPEEGSLVLMAVDKDMQATTDKEQA